MRYTEPPVYEDYRGTTGTTAAVASRASRTRYEDVWGDAGAAYYDEEEVRVQHHVRGKEANQTGIQINLCLNFYTHCTGS